MYRHRGVKRILQFWQGMLSLQQVRVEADVLTCFVASLSFIFLFLPCRSLSSPLLSLLSVFSLSLETTQNDPQGLT